MTKASGVSESQTVNCTIALLALIISYAIFVHTQGSPLALELSHR